MESDNWRSRIETVLRDNTQAEKAALLYFLVTDHLRKCQHQRRCPEELLIEEVDMLHSGLERNKRVT